MIIFKIAYWVGIVVQVVLRAPFAMQVRSSKKTDRRVSRTETILLGLLTIGGAVIPLVYTFTPWLDFANYSLPPWLGYAGIAVLAASLYLFGRSHADLKSNWSSSLEIYEGHSLVTSGIYRYIRHPMYASQLVAAVAQVLLLQNWIAGLTGLVVFILFYTLRIGAEEKMMLETFGEQYRQYMQNTGRIIPKL